MYTPLHEEDEKASESNSSFHEEETNGDRVSAKKNLTKNNSNIFKSKIAKQEANLYRYTYGEARGDSSDENSEINSEIRDTLAKASPRTRGRIKSEASFKETGKNGPVKTFFTLIKGFIAAGVLFIPKGWCNGGWLFSSLAMIASWALTTVTSLKLLQIRK